MLKSPNVEKFHIFTKYTHFLSVIQNDLSWLNNLLMVNFQLISMSSYAKNKQQMCWVTQHQCRSRQMWKIVTNSPSTLTFVCYKKLLVYTEQSIHYKCWVTQLQCRSHQMWKIFTNSPSTLTFCLLQKMTSLAWTIYSW